MATIDYSKQTSRKLKNMLNGELSDEARQAIENELQKREAANAAAQSADASQSGPIVADCGEASELSPEEQAAVAAAEAEYNKEQKEGRKTLLSLSPEEVATRKSEMEAQIGHKCKVMPSGEVEWFDGAITGVTHDKRSNAVMYTIKLLESKKTVRKAYGAKSLVISEETIELPTNARSVVAGSQGNKRSADEAEDLREKAQERRGQYALLPVGNEKVKGYVNGVMWDKRSNAVLFCFALENGSKKYKAVTAEIEWLDEHKEGVREPKQAEKLNPIQYVRECAEKRNKLQEQIAKLQDRLKAVEADFEKANEAAIAWLETDEGKAYEASIKLPAPPAEVEISDDVLG